MPIMKEEGNHPQRRWTELIFAELASFTREMKVTATTNAFQGHASISLSCHP